MNLFINSKHWVGDLVIWLCVIRFFEMLAEGQSDKKEGFFFSA